MLKPQLELINFRFLLRQLPGILFLFGIGYLGKTVEQLIKSYGKANHLLLPNIEYVLWAILFGMIIANTIGVPKILKPGVATYEFWLRIGIAFLGARFLFSDVLKLGGFTISLVAIELFLSLSLMVVLGRLFGLGEKLTHLLAIGISICGVSAIIAGKGAIDAEDDDAAYAISMILLLGAIGLFIYPLVGHLIHLDNYLFGIWAGLVVDNTAETAAVGAIYAEEAGKIAVLVKAARNATIGFVTLGFALYWAVRGQATDVTNKGLFLWQKFPKFVLGFLLLSLLGTVGLFTPEQLTSLGNLSRWALLFAFAGVGLSLDLRTIRQLGTVPLIALLIAKVIIVYLVFSVVAVIDSLGLLQFVIPH